MSDFLVNLAKRAAGLPPTVATLLPAHPPEPGQWDELGPLDVAEAGGPESVAELPPRSAAPDANPPADELRPSTRAEDARQLQSPAPNPEERTSTKVQATEIHASDPPPSREILDSSTTESPRSPGSEREPIETVAPAPSELSGTVDRPSPSSPPKSVRAEAREAAPEPLLGLSDEMLSTLSPIEPSAREEAEPERPADHEAHIVPRPMPDQRFGPAPETAVVTHRTEPTRPPVEVRIGRIDIEVARAMPPPAAPAPRERPRGFDDYARLRSYLER